MDPSRYRKTKEILRKPYRSTASYYEDYKKEIPDGDYYGLKHSEFKKPWLPYPGGYDEMEYRWDFPLEYLDPIDFDIEVPDAGSYEYPPNSGGSPTWPPIRWNPTQDPPDFPAPKPEGYTGPGGGEGGPATINWKYCEGLSFFDWCPGETITASFEEHVTDPIVSADCDEGEVTGGGPRGGWNGKATRVFDAEVLMDPDSTASRATVTAVTSSGAKCEVNGFKRSGCVSGGCSGVSISYTSLTQPVGTRQTLTVDNPVEWAQYRWEAEGGGMLTEQKGTATVLIAPDNNVNCDSNTTVRLKDDATGETCDSITVGHPAAPGAPGSPGLTDVAYSQVEDDGECRATYSPVSGWCYFSYRYYNCYGGLLLSAEGFKTSVSCSIPPCTYHPVNGYSCQDKPCVSDDEDWQPGTHDLRTAVLLEKQCCPGALA